MVDDTNSSFEDAESRFQVFLKDQGFLNDVLYVASGDAILTGGQWYVKPPNPAVSRRRARATYDRAVSRRLGVVLSVVCRVEDRLCAFVNGPSDGNEAERLMYPNGLKLSVPTNLHTATVVRGARWWYLKSREVLEFRRRG